MTAKIGNQRSQVTAAILTTREIERKRSECAWLPLQKLHNVFESNHYFFSFYLAVSDVIGNIWERPDVCAYDVSGHQHWHTDTSAH